MKKRLLHGLTATAVLIGLSVLLIGLTSRGDIRSAEQVTGEHPDEHAGHAQGDADHGHEDMADTHGADDHDAHADVHEDDAHKHEGADGHEHEHGPAFDPGNKEALFAAQCEHDISIVECGDCRYEVGVVKIERSLANGLLDTQVVEAETSVETMLRLTGEVQLDLARVVEVASVGNGRVERLDKILGDEVKASTVLAVIQSSELGRAQAEFLTSKAKLDLSRATLEREDKLYKQQISSEADFLTAGNAFKAAEAKMVAAKKSLQLFGLSEDQVQSFARQQTNGTFGQLVLTAPIDGIITEQNIVRGRLVGSTDTLYTIADLSQVWVWCDVYERDLAALYELAALGQSTTADIRVSAFPKEVFKGTVDIIGNEVNRETRTVKVRIIAQNPATKLKPGMFADVRIGLPQTQSVIRIPETAVMYDSSDRFVFVHLKDDLWIRRDITPGETKDGLVLVRDGLETGITIATKGAFMFKSEVLKEKMGAGCAH
jgi:cobalt-zinc-cadmium efflux system membrane fusion protein